MKPLLILICSLLSLPTFANSSLNWDLGYSIGSTNGESYSEANLGLNWNATEWFLWRNSIFGRFYSNEDIDDTFGLDTSARFHHTFEFDQSSNMTLFGGPGWRFASEGESPPFVEGGLNVRLAGLNVGGGAKVIFNEVMDSDVPNGTQYFITLSGSGVVGGN